MKAQNRIKILKDQSFRSAKNTRSWSQQLSFIILEAKPITKLAGKICLAIEYIQLLSQALTLYPALYKSSENSQFSSFFLNILKFINPTSIPSLEGDSTSAAKGILYIIISCMILKFLAYLYMIVIIVLDLKGDHRIGMKIVQWIFRIQTRVIYYFISSFWVSILVLYKIEGAAQFNVLGLGRYSYKLTCIAMVVIEFLVSLLPKLFYHYLLPGKDFLASKDNYTEIITLVQKFTIQIIQISVPIDSVAAHWVLTVVNLIISMIRNIQYFLVLPFYKIEALFYHGRLLLIVTSVNLTCVIHLYLNSIDSEISYKFPFIIVTGIILSVLSIKIFNQGLNKKLIHVITTQKQQDIPLLLHKASIITQFAELQEKSYSHGISLLIAAMNNTFKQAFGLHEQNFEITSKEALKGFILSFMHDLEKKQPEDSLLKLHLAYYAIKAKRSWANCIASLIKLAKENNYQVKYSAWILLRKMETLIQEQYQRSTTCINLHSYLKSQNYMDDLKRSILRQAELQCDMYTELLNSTPNLDKVFQDAQLARKYQKDAVKRIKRLQDFTPPYFVSPLALCGYYQLIVNHSLADYNHAYYNYNLQYRKYQSIFKSEKISEENIFQENCAFFAVSVNKSEAGKIVYCSKSVKNVCGGDPEDYIGLKIYEKVTLRGFKQTSESFYKSFSESGSYNHVLNHVRPSYFSHEEGYLMQGTYYMNIHPVITQGFFLTMIVRPQPTKHDFLIVRESGEIEGGSKHISKRLGIRNSSKKAAFHIKEISVELDKVHKAFLMVKDEGKDQKMNEMSLEEAREISSLYGEKGNQADLSSLIRTDEVYKYHCQASLLNYGGPHAFIITLHKMKDSFEVENDDDEMTNVDEEIEGTQRPRKFGSQEEANDDDEEFHLSFLNSKRNQLTLTPQTSERHSKNILPMIMMKKKSLFIKKHEQSTQQSSETLKVQFAIKDAALDVRINQQSSESSRRSTNGGRAKSFDEYLEIKTYPAHWKLSFVGFLISLAAIFASLIYLDQKMKDLTQDLRAKKDIMVNSLFRAYNLVTIQGSLRMLYDIQRGVLVNSELGSLAKPISGHIAVVEKYTQSIIEINKAVQNQTYLLDKSINEEFYLKDVTVIYSSSTAKMDSFEATDLIIQKFLSVIKTAKKNVSITEETSNFLNTNLLNSLDIKNDLLADLTLKSVQNQNDVLQGVYEKYIVLIILLNLVLALVILKTIRNQYSRNRKLMFGVMNLSSRAIECLLENQKKFSNVLAKENNLNFMEMAFYNCIDSPQLANFLPMEIRNSKKRSIESINFTSTKKRFLLYSVVLGFLVLVLSLVMILSYLPTSKSIGNFNKKILQINYLARASSNFARANTASMEIFASNNTLEMRNELVETAYKGFIKTVASLRDQLLTLFIDEELLEDQKVQKILFGDGCYLLDEAEWIYCNALVSKSIKGNLVQMMAKFEAYLTERYLKYQKSDKSAASLKAIRTNDIDVLFTLKRTMSNECILLLSLVDNAFEDRLKRFDRDKDVGFSVSLVTFSLMIGVIWLLVLYPVKEQDNRFKNVLKAFPPKVIISNFVLKKFILETSPNAFSFYDNIQ